MELPAKRIAFTCGTHSISCGFFKSYMRALRVCVLIRRRFGFGAFVSLNVHLVRSLARTIALPCIFSFLHHYLPCLHISILIFFQLPKFTTNWKLIQNYEIFCIVILILSIIFWSFFHKLCMAEYFLVLGCLDMYACLTLPCYIICEMLDSYPMLMKFCML